MNTSKISVRYAKALFLAAQEKDLLERIFRDATLLDQVLGEVPEFRETLGNPVLTEKEKKDILEKTFAPYLDDLTLRFLDLLATNNRLIFLPDMVRDFIELYKKEQGISFARLITAVPISRETVDKIAANLRKALGNEVRLTPETDPDLIGGFILRIDDLQFDASVASALKKFKKELTKGK